MRAMASQITSLSIVCSAIYQRKHQSSASLVFVRGIHWWPVNARMKGQWRGKCFHLMTLSYEVPNQYNLRKFLPRWLVCITIQSFDPCVSITLSQCTSDISQFCYFFIQIIQEGCHISRPWRRAMGVLFWICRHLVPSCVIGCREIPRPYHIVYWTSVKCTQGFVLLCSVAMISSALNVTCWPVFIGIISMTLVQSYHDDVIKWNHFLRYWSLMWGIHRSPVNSPHKGQWRGALIFPWSAPWINGWVHNREAGDLGRHCVHYDAIVMWLPKCPWYGPGMCGW